MAPTVRSTGPPRIALAQVCREMALRGAMLRQRTRRSTSLVRQNCLSQWVAISNQHWSTTYRVETASQLQIAYRSVIPRLNTQSNVTPDTYLKDF